MFCSLSSSMAMASSSNQIRIFFFFFFFLTFFSSSHARDSQFFNKVPSATNDNSEQQRDPSFLPDNETAYGLEVQLPPSATTTTTPAAAVPNTESKRPLSKYLPKNYNPVAYVTQPEDFNDNGDTFSEENSLSAAADPYTNNNYNNNGGKSYDNQQEVEETDRYRSFPYTTNNKYYYAGGSSFNSEPQVSNSGGGGSTFNSGDRSFNNGGDSTNSFRPQGMSDTRFLENGKYFYDVNTQRYSSNHPYESLRGNARSRNRNYFGNSDNGYEFDNENSIGGYPEFQETLNNNLP